MYNCDKCGRPSPSGKKQLTRVVKSRKKTYINAATERVEGKGWEIVKEKKLCKKCFDAAA
jgi:DNA-directed RNA polymerase subunit M/transcription elongation factor TFIIS